jgi:NADP-dependent 3-hydroxy acid dehydrogenase YdfG
MKLKPVDNLGRKMSISKKVTVVTGASSGLGRSIALLFAQNGAKVVLASRDETKLKEVAEEIHQKGGEAASVVTDVRNERQCARLIEEAIKNYGRIDVLVNNAGIGIYGPVEEFSTPFWKKVPRKPDVSKFLKPEHVAQLVLYIASTPDDMVFEDIVVQPKDEYVRRFA